MLLRIYFFLSPNFFYYSNQIVVEQPAASFPEFQLLAG